MEDDEEKINDRTLKKIWSILTGLIFERKNVGVQPSYRTECFKVTYLITKSMGSLRQSFDELRSKKLLLPIDHNVF